MATNKKITDLTELTEVELADDDVLAIVDVSDSTTKKVRKSAFTSALAGVSTISAVSPISVNQATGTVVVNLSGAVSIANGGTGATDAAAALTALGGMAGPVSATDNAVARFDATTGKLLQNSTVTISDSGAITVAGAITVGGNVVSDIDSTDDLGTTGVRWANTWTDAINGVTAPTAQYTSAEETKLAGIETAADVTDVTNVLLALVGQEVAATGFTGTLDGVLGGGQPAAAIVTDLRAGYVTGTSNLFLRNLSGTNRIDSYNDPITAAYPLRINSSYCVFAIADVEKIRIATNGYVGIGTTAPAEMLTVGSVSSADNYVLIQSTNNTESGVKFRSDSSATSGVDICYEGNGNFTDFRTVVTGTPTSRMTIAAAGTVNVVGTFTAGTKTFRIDHPLPAKTDTHYLLHSSIEGPQADLIYRGRADLVSGTVDVNIDTEAGMTEGTFEVLCADVQCFTSNEDGWTALKGTITGNVLTITAQDDTCTDTVSWMVIGERKDAKMIESEWADDDGKLIVETLKSEHE